MTTLDVVSPMTLPADPTAPMHPATKGYVDALTRSNGNDYARYGDVISSIERRLATAWEEYTTNGATFSGTVSPRSFTATKIRTFVDTASVGATSAFLAVYTGTSLSALTLRGQYSGTDTFATVGIRELTLSSSVPINIGDYVLAFYASQGATTSPRIKVTVGSTSELINPGPLVYEGYGTTSVAPPSTLNTTTGWTKTNTTPWWALV